MADLHTEKVRKGEILSAHAESLVRQALDAAGCRYTAQRAAVFDYLESVQSHPTAEEVYRAVRRRLPRISLATVYKALEALVEARLATKLTNGDGSAHYDCRGEDHYHLRDVSTGEICDLPVEFDPHLLAKLDPSLVDRLSSSGFEVTGYRLEVLGRFSEDLAALQRAIRWGDGETLFNLFTRTRAIRRSIIEAGQDTAEEDFGRPHDAGGDSGLS